MSAPFPAPAGILLVDKEAGWTSHDVVAKLRGLLRQRRVGHAGTLDPAATGLLVACVGQATRLVEYMTPGVKEYTGEIVLGVTTETDDAEGAVIATATPPALSGADLRRLEAEFTGVLMQRPPAYSAVKVAGQRAYRAARRGDALTLEPRPVTIHEIELASPGDNRLRVRLRCGAGTYVRSIARDIGDRLGCGAHLAALRRTSSGRFEVADARTIAELTNLADEGCIAEAVLPLDEGLLGMDAAVVSAENATRLRRGQQPLVAVEGGRYGAEARVYTAAGEFLAVATLTESGRLVARKVLGEAP